MSSQLAEILRKKRAAAAAAAASEVVEKEPPEEIEETTPEPEKVEEKAPEPEPEKVKAVEEPVVEEPKKAKPEAAKKKKKEEPEEVEEESPEDDDPEIVSSESKPGSRYLKGVSTQDYITFLNVLKKMIRNSDPMEDEAVEAGKERKIRKFTIADETRLGKSVVTLEARQHPCRIFPDRLKTGKITFHVNHAFLRIQVNEGTKYTFDQNIGKWETAEPSKEIIELAKSMPEATPKMFEKAK